MRMVNVYVTRLLWASSYWVQPKAAPELGQLF